MNPMLNPKQNHSCLLGYQNDKNTILDCDNTEDRKTIQYKPQLNPQLNAYMKDLHNTLEEDEPKDPDEVDEL